jgi:hypothetical protein
MTHETLDGTGAKFEGVQLALLEGGSFIPTGHYWIGDGTLKKPKERDTFIVFIDAETGHIVLRGETSYGS